MTSALLALALTSTGINPPPLVGFDELQRSLKTPGVRLLDARSKAEYDKEHIPGAVWVDVKAASALASRPGGLDDAAAWSAWVRPLGISSDAKVLIYDGAKQLEAARTWWLLSYLGLKNAGLVDGNFPLWKKEKRPTTSETTTVEPVDLRVRFDTSRLARKSTVLRALEGDSVKLRVVDARSLAEHTGERAMSKRGGRIPDSCHLEWSDLVDADGRFLERSALEKLAAKSGVKPGETVVTHCQGGGRASVNAFVMERLGHPTANYYLGWSDWGNDDATPVTKGKPDAPK